ncbi:maleate cis-trans isomerase family protein [Streptomyces meridianus]|uniref:Maleate cis-trans isomerase n=1 Tax=Streptomyces meridianus TaxID=2938945 RepID=A0ABT0X8D2_9ACTN|nr:hypothetical protein [Streptomyces meridianus]MCM2578585.1 hypothetical protein [Streptomyces meridianus]
MPGTERGEAPRIGILVIHNDPVPEIEMNDVAPVGVSVHAARFECPRPHDGEYVGSAAQAFVEAPDVSRGLDHLGQLGADSIGLCFGSSSFFGGVAFDEEFVERARSHAHGVPVFTAAMAITAALRSAAVRRPLVVMPPWFTRPTFEATEKYLAEVGVECGGMMQFDLGDEWKDVKRYNSFDEGARWVVRGEEVCRQVSEGFPDGVDGVLIPGSGFRAQEAVVPLEKELGVPVITSNQACLWYGLRSVGSRVSGFPSPCGRLLELPLAAE